MENFLDTNFDKPSEVWCGCYGPLGIKLPHKTWVDKGCDAMLSLPTFVFAASIMTGTLLMIGATILIIVTIFGAF